MSSCMIKDMTSLTTLSSNACSHMVDTLHNRGWLSSVMARFATFVSWVTVSSLGWIHYHTVVQPLETLYLHGPSFLGCWEGKPVEDICVLLSPRSRAEFWNQHPEECTNMIEKNMYSWILMTKYVVGFLACWTIVKLLYSWWWRRHMFHQLETLLLQMNQTPSIGNKKYIK